MTPSAAQPGVRDMAMLLSAQAVSYAYTPGVAALAGADIQIAPGCMTGIVGPNGSGKSTLLRLLCGLLAPDSGTITLDGKALARIAPRSRAQILGYLPQAVQPAFSLTAFETVCLGRYPYTGALGSLRETDLDIARRCMADTQTSDLRDRDFSTLSGGERQRVLIAGSLAQEPNLLLLDEPTAALDLHHAREVFALMRRLADEGLGIAVVTHDLNLAAQYCDALTLIGGDHRVHAAGSPAEVMTESTLGAAYASTIRVGKHPFAGTPFAAADGASR